MRARTGSPPSSGGDRPTRCYACFLLQSGKKKPKHWLITTIVLHLPLPSHTTYSPGDSRTKIHVHIITTIVLHLLLPLLNRLSDPSREIANVTPPSYAQRSPQIAHIRIHHIQSGRKKHSSAPLGKGVAPQPHVLLI